MHHPHPDSPGRPTIQPPSINGRIEAALMTLACNGQPGLATRMALMYPSTDFVSAESCNKFATIVLTRTIAALVEALPAERSGQIQKELADYLSEFFESA